MRYENLADKGVKQDGYPDVHTIYIYNPEVIAAKTSMDLEMGGALAITSGYRDRNVDPEVKNSPHKFAIALDLAAGKLEKQVEWARVAVKHFNRVGLYPQRGIIHVDMADPEWIETYNGAKYWVCLNDKYTGFETLEQAITYATSMEKTIHGGVV